MSKVSGQDLIQLIQLLSIGVWCHLKCVLRRHKELADTSSHTTLSGQLNPAQCGLGHSNQYSLKYDFILFLL